MTVINNKPAEPIISRTDIGYTIIKQRFGTDTDYDLSKVGGWSRQSVQGAEMAVYSEIPYDKDSRIFTWSGLVHDTSYVVSLSYLDDFILGSPALIQAQYQLENSLDVKHSTVRTKDPILLTSITNEVDEGVVANPFSNLIFTYTGEADAIRIQVRKVTTSDWSTIFEGKPVQGLKLSVAGGTYELRYVSIIGFSDGTVEEFPARTWPEEIVVESGLGAPVEVSGLTLASFKTPGSTAAYDLRIAWVYPTDPANQNKKRNFTVTVLPNPTLTTDYASLNWSLASEEIAINSPYVIKPFPYKTPYVVRIGVMGWGTEASDYVYAPVFVSKDTGDSGQLGYLVPSDSEAPITSKIQIDDEHIRAYSVFNPSNPAENKLMFEVDAATGNVIIGRAGGAYNNTAITTAPFIFDSQNNKLQVSGRVITDQIESASYVLTWIDGDSPSLRTAGKSGYGSGAPGIWMGYTSPTTFAFDLGNATNFMRWDGENLTISGTVRIGNDGRTVGQAQKQVFIYKRSSTGVPATPSGGTYASPAPAGWSTTVPTGSDELYMSSRLFTSDGMPPQEVSWASPSLFQPGSTGTATTYTWIKYADDAIGTGISDDPTGKTYLGIAVNKMSATESNSPADYVWSRMTGTDGVPGTPGTDGQTLYTWIKYSPNANGVPMTELPDSNTQYIGISPNRDTATESSNAADYTWSKFKGDQGVPGVNNFKSTVFRRSATNPGTPTGGSYSSPIPTSGGWSDGIPGGEEVLWASTRIFAADNVSPPHQASWSAPVAMTNTSDLEIRYSTLASSPGDPTSNAANWSTSASADTVWMAQRTKTNGVWSAWNVTKIKGEAGAPGAPGADGRVLSLTASTQTITFNSQDVMTPAGQSINFTVYRANITANTTWSAVDESGNVVAISGTNTSATLDGSALQSRKSISVTATAGGLSDTISIAKVRDGSDAIIAILSNESHGVAASSTGVVSSFAGAGGNMRVYRGTSEITNSCAFAVTSSSGATGSIDASGAYSVSAMSADVGTLTLTATFGSTTISKVFTVTKVRAGLIGKRGAGQYSAVYANPTPGSISAGMASAAKAACPDGTPVVGDIVTLRDSDPTKVPVSMTYNGPGDGSSAGDWALFSVTIDGNLLVNGTVGADKINVNDLYSKNASVSGRLQVGSGGTYTVLDGVTGGIDCYVGGNRIFAALGGVGHVQGSYLVDSSVSKTKLSPDVINWITEIASGGNGFDYGGAATVSSTLFSQTFSMSPALACAAGSVTLSFNYPGTGRYHVSVSNPGVSYILIRYKMNTSYLHTAVQFNGTVTSSGPNEWYCTLPDITDSRNFTVPQGNHTFSVEVTLVTSITFSNVGTFNAGAFQEPSGPGVTNMNINDLTDVAITTATNGQVLTFENGNWINKAPTGGGGGGSVLTFGNGLVAGSYNGSAPVTIAVNTSTGVSPNTVVARDASGNFAANTIYAYLDGTARDADKLKTVRSITANGDVLLGWNFDGSGNVVDSNARLAEIHAAAFTTNSVGNVLPIIGFDRKGRMTSLNSVDIRVSTLKHSEGGTSNAVEGTSDGARVRRSGAGTSYVHFGSSSDAVAGGSGTVSIDASGNQIAAFNTSSVTFTRNTGVQGSLNVGGTIVAGSTITGTDCIATSDIRVKTGLKRIDNPIERLKKLKGGYTFNRTDMDNIRHAGVIANYVKEALPEAIFVGKDSDLLTVSHSGMLGLLVEVCTEQQRRIEELERRLNGNV